MLNPIWGFCSIELKLIKLACCFDVIDHFNQFSNLCNGQLVIFLKKLTSGLNFFWGFSQKLYAQANFVSLNLIWTKFTALAHASCHLICSCIIQFFFFFFLVLLFLILAPCLGRLELLGFPLPLLYLLLGFNCLGMSVCVRPMRNLIVNVRFWLSVL